MDVSWTCPKVWSLYEESEERGSMTVPQQVNSVRVLLVSADIKVIEAVCRWSQHVTMHIEPCCDGDSAMRKLCHSKFEGVVVDLEAEGGSALLKKLRTLTSNKSALSFAVLPTQHDAKSRYFTPANFIVHRPIHPSTMLRLLKAAYPLMVREKRRYFRCPVHTSVFVTRGRDMEFTLQSLNISEGGICLNSPVPMQVGDQLTLRLYLPGNPECLNLSGEVCWSESMGRIGIQFVGLTDKAKLALQNWLAERLQGGIADAERRSDDHSGSGAT